MNWVLAPTSAGCAALGHYFVMDSGVGGVPVAGATRTAANRSCVQRRPSFGATLKKGKDLLRWLLLSRLNDFEMRLVSPTAFTFSPRSSLKSMPWTGYSSVQRVLYSSLTEDLKARRLHRSSVCDASATMASALAIRSCFPVSPSELPSKKACAKLKNRTSWFSGTFEGPHPGSTRL